MAREGLKIGLAVSLNAADDALRSRIMSINRRWPIAELLEAVRTYRQRIDQRVTFEYVLLHGLNDSIEDADRLVALVRAIPCKINVIPWNPVESTAFVRPPRDAVDRFVHVLRNARLTTTVRYSRGVDIAAGCGQLYLRPDAAESAAGA